MYPMTYSKRNLVTHINDAMRISFAFYFGDTETAGHLLAKSTLGADGLNWNECVQVS